MSGKTKYSISVVFDNNVTLSPVPSSKLQKVKGGQKTKKTLGTTKPRATIDVPVLHWDEVTDPIAKTVTLALKEFIVTVTYSTRIWVDQAIDKKSPCYAHVLDHEERHVKIWKQGVKKEAATICKAVEAVAVPSTDKPVQMKLSEAGKFRDACFKELSAALDAAVQAAGIKIGQASKKIHTAAELKKTNTLCAAYLI